MTAPNIKLSRVELDYSERVPKLKLIFVDDKTKKEFTVDRVNFTRRTLGLIENECLEILQHEMEG